MLFVGVGVEIWDLATTTVGIDASLMTTTTTIGGWVDAMWDAGRRWTDSDGDRDIVARQVVFAHLIKDHFDDLHLGARLEAMLADLLDAQVRALTREQRLERRRIMVGGGLLLMLMASALLAATLAARAWRAPSPPSPPPPPPPLPSPTAMRGRRAPRPPLSAALAMGGALTADPAEVLLAQKQRQRQRQQREQRRVAQSGWAHVYNNLLPDDDEGEGEGLGGSRSGTLSVASSVEIDFAEDF
jgi:hypothetical protein